MKKFLTVKECLAAALLACHLLRKQADLTTYREESESLLENSSFFEKLSIELITQCYSANNEIAQLLLIRSISILTGRTCIELAYDAGCIQFLSHICCIRLIERVWMGHILPGYRLIRIVFTTLCPPLLFTLKFRSKREIRNLTSSPDSQVFGNDSTL